MRQEPLRPPYHDRDHEPAEGEHAESREIAEPFRPTDQHDGRQHDADLAAHAAENDDREDDGGFHEIEALGTDEALPRRKERPGKPREHGADRESRELGVARIDAEGTAGDLVLAQSLPGAADRQLSNSQREPAGDEGEQQDDVIQPDDTMDR